MSTHLAVAAFPVSKKAPFLGQASHPPILGPCWSQIRARIPGPLSLQKSWTFHAERLLENQWKLTWKLCHTGELRTSSWVTQKVPPSSSIFSWSSIQPIRKLLGFQAGKGRILPRGTRYVLVSTRLQNLTIFNIKSCDAYQQPDLFTTACLGSTLQSFRNITHPRI